MSVTNEIFEDAPRKSNDDMEKFNKDQYLEEIRKLFDDTTKIVDFDTWTIKQQRDWTHQNVIKHFSNVPETLKNLMPATYRLIDFNRSQEKLPEWMNMDKYRRGQKFVREHYFSIIVATLFGTIYSFSFDDGLKPVIIAGNSHTPYLAFKRYLHTVKRIFAWFDGEPWIKDTEAYTDMQITRRKHLILSKKISRLDYKQYQAASKFADPWCPEYETLVKDFDLSCPFEKPGQRPYKIMDDISYKPKSINNATLAVAQANFIILPMLYPENIGIHGATDEELEAFCHMWRCYGYFLGIEDEYNFCHGSLEEIKQCLRDLNQHWNLVNFKEIKPEFVHVTKCMAEFINYHPWIYLPYKTMTLLVMESLNLNMPNLYASLSYTEWVVHKMYRFMFDYVLKFSNMRAVINRAVYKVIKAALNFDSKKLAKLHEKSKQTVPDFCINL